ncbi:MAG: HD domain-containing protein [bacterium]|nr:HD domain-containing protein [bacterium]
MNLMDDKILAKIKTLKTPCYLVGGSVRDFLMYKIYSHDKDIAVLGAENFAKKLAVEFDATFIVLDEINKIFRVVLKDKINYIDVSEIVGKSIEEDLIRRDFTINAIAYDILNEKIIDVTGGLEDIKKRRLNLIKEENLIEDPLRILRAFRFYALSGFEMTQELKKCLMKHRDIVLSPAKERINYELMKLFGGKYAVKSLLLMDELQILELIFPFVKEFKKVPPNAHHHLNLFMHTIETVNFIQKFYEKANDEEKKHLDSVDFGGFPRINHLKLAGFMHDIGKFSTWTIDETGRHRFIGHDEIGSKLAEKFLKEYKFSKKQIEYVSSMIKKHMYPSSVLCAPDLNDKVKMRYVRKMNENLIDNIIIAKSDRLSARGVEITDEMVKKNLDGLNALEEFYFSHKELLKPLPVLLNGNEIMEILKIPAGKELGLIIKNLKEAQINGDILTKEQAIDFIKRCYTN